MSGLDAMVASRALRLLVATFLVDFTCFEDDQGRRNLLDFLD